MEGCTIDGILQRGAIAVWPYDPHTQDYSEENIIKKGHGFWVLFSDMPKNVYSIPPVPEDGECNQNVINKIERADAWHILVATGGGCNRASLMNKGAVALNLYDPKLNSYVIKNSINMGEGFWIRVDKDFGQSSSSQSSSSQASSIVNNDPILENTIANRDWITPNREMCQKGGGVFQSRNLEFEDREYKIPYCYANWNDSIKICQSIEAKLPEIGDLREAILSCQGEPMRAKEYDATIANKNINKIEYQECILNSGFFPFSLYWSSTEDIRNNSIYSVYFQTAHINTYLKSSERYFRCIKSSF
jgi:hypothetical protein